MTRAMALWGAAVCLCVASLIVGEYGIANTYSAVSLVIAALGGRE
jgi:hypothetical protein